MAVVDLDRNHGTAQKSTPYRTIVRTRRSRVRRICACIGKQESPITLGNTRSGSPSMITVMLPIPLAKGQQQMKGVAALEGQPLKRMQVVKAATSCRKRGRLQSWRKANRGFQSMELLNGRLPAHSTHHGHFTSTINTTILEEITLIRCKLHQIEITSRKQIMTASRPKRS
jgi:hypothetical protein